MTTNVCGSIGLTCHSMLDSNRVNAAATGNPARMPQAVNNTPGRRTSRRIWPGPAPSATRMPISRVRWLTEYAAVTVDDVRELSQALLHIDERQTVRALARVFGELEQRDLERAVTRWVSGAE